MLGPSIFVTATPLAFGASIYAVRKPGRRGMSLTALILSSVELIVLAVVALMGAGVI